MTYIRVQNRRGTQTQWETNNTVLAAGEIGLNLTNGKFKIGTGDKAWSQLSYGLGSAYDVATANGFEGTEEDWLDSLIGPAGPAGPKGDTGNQGPEGPEVSLINLAVTSADPAQTVVRNITTKTYAPSPSDGINGDVWIVY